MNIDCDYDLSEMLHTTNSHFQFIAIVIQNLLSLFPPMDNDNSTVTTDESFQENSNADQDLLDAVKSVPLKDYSEYEIEIEAKEEYSDALFADETALDEALKPASKSAPLTPTKPENLDTSNKQSVAKNVQAKNESNPTAKDKPGLKVNIQLTPSEVFLKAITRPQGNTASEEKEKLSIISNQINGSNARKTLPLGDEAHQFELQLARIRDEIADEKERLKNQYNPQPVHIEKSAKDGGKMAALARSLKVKSLEMSRLGKSKFDKSKAELDQYLGLSLPDRNISLDFLLPTVKNLQQDKELPSTDDIEQRFSTKGRPLLATLEKVAEGLNSLSKADIPSRKRIALLRAYRPIVVEKIHSVINMFQRKPCAYDDSNRVKMVGQGLRILKYIIASYKRVYADIYSANNVIYASQRQHANKLACELLECIFLEQQFCIATHTTIPSNSIKAFNKIILVLSTYESEFLLEQQSLLVTNKSYTLTDLFKYYTLLSSVDASSISSTVHKSMYLYIENYLDLIEVIPTELSCRLSEQKPGQQIWQIIENAGSHSQCFGPEEIITNLSDQAGILLKPQMFLNRIKHDYVETLKASIIGKKEIKLLPLGEQPLAVVLELFVALNRCVKMIERNQSSSDFSLFQTIVMKAYSGIQPSINTLKFFHQEGSTINKGSERLEKPESSTSRWRCAQFDSKQAFLQVNEASLGVTIDIDSLILLVRPAENENSADNEDEKADQKPDDGNSLIYLARVSNMHRDSKGNVNYTASILGSQISYVEIDKNPALVVKNDSDVFLITDNNVEYFSDEVKDICFPDGNIISSVITGLAGIARGCQILKVK